VQRPAFQSSDRPLGVSSHHFVAAVHRRVVHEVSWTVYENKRKREVQLSPRYRATLRASVFQRQDARKEVVV